MNETPANAKPAKTLEDDVAARLLLEAQALRHVLRLPPDERAAAAAKLNDAALQLVGLCKAVERVLARGESLDLPDVVAMLDGRPELAREAQDLEACPQAGAVFSPDEGLDPAVAADAFNRSLEDTARRGDLARAADAAQLLAKAKAAKTPAERRSALGDAVHVLEAAERAEVVPLAEAWDLYRASRFDKPEAGKRDAVLLDTRRGIWADWFNRNLGPRGGLEPGKLLLVGGGPAGGKTTLGAVLTVDAMDAGCPVLFWQLELSREETLEHLMAQADPSKAKTHWNMKANLPLPDAWPDLLTLPRNNGPEAAHVENIIRAMEAQARKARKLDAHAVRGLVVVDYAQLLGVEDRTARDARFEVLEKAASRLAKAASECGAALVLLSQVNKGARKDNEAMAGTSYAGADLERMAHVAVMLWKAKAGKAAAANEKADYNEEDGEARSMYFTKRRGTLYRHGAPDPERLLWYSTAGRSLHDGHRLPMDLATPNPVPDLLAQE